MSDQKEASQCKRIGHELLDRDGRISQLRSLDECDVVIPMQGGYSAGFRKACEQMQLILFGREADGVPYLRQCANGQHYIGLQRDQ